MGTNQSRFRSMAYSPMLLRQDHTLGQDLATFLINTRPLEGGNIIAIFGQVAQQKPLNLCWGRDLVLVKDGSMPIDSADLEVGFFEGPA